MKCITYKDGYIYQLTQDYNVTTGIIPTESISADGYIELSADGDLFIKKGYAWDGPSGPTIDTPNFMRGSLVHDAFYQLMRNDKLDRELYRKPVDKLLVEMCKEDGMSSVRAAWVYLGIRIGGKAATESINKKHDIHAPEHCQAGDEL